MSSRQNLPTRAAAIFDTWGRALVGRIIFYIGENELVTSANSAPLGGVKENVGNYSGFRKGFSGANDKVTDSSRIHVYNNLPVVELSGVTDDAYPPREKSFSMIRHMHEHFGARFRWFLRADDDVFVRVESLLNFIDSVDSSRPWYMGQPGRGIPGEMGRLGLKEGEPYCMGGPGVLFSRPALTILVPHLKGCAEQTVTSHEDSELGRCVQQNVNISCTKSKQMTKLFYQNYNDKNGSFSGPVDRRAFLALTLHPVKDPRQMYRLHMLFTNRQLMHLQQQHQLLRATLSALDARLHETTNRMFTGAERLRVQKRSVVQMKDVSANIQQGIQTSLNILKEPHSELNYENWRHSAASHLARAREVTPGSEISKYNTSWKATNGMLSENIYGSHIREPETETESISDSIPVSYGSSESKERMDISQRSLNTIHNDRVTDGQEETNRWSFLADTSNLPVMHSVHISSHSSESRHNFKAIEVSSSKSITGSDSENSSALVNEHDRDADFWDIICRDDLCFSYESYVHPTRKHAFAKARHHLEIYGKQVAHSEKHIGDLIAYSQRLSILHGVQHLLTISTEGHYHTILVSTGFQGLQWQEVDSHNKNVTGSTIPESEEEPVIHWQNAKERNFSTNKAHGSTMGEVPLQASGHLKGGRSIDTGEKAGEASFHGQHDIGEKSQRRLPLWILLPLYGRPKAYARFMQHISTAARKYNGPVNLRVALFPDVWGNHDHSMTLTQKYIQASHNGSNLDIMLIPMNETFSRARALQRLASGLEEDSLLVLMDVDLLLTVDFLHRASSNAGPGRVYFPVYLAQYHPDTVCYRVQHCTPQLFDYSRDAGTWRHFSYGVASLTCGDLDGVGGLDTSIKGWGKEDVDLYSRCVSSGLNVMRAIDPGLMHVHHNRSCDPTLAQDQMRMCRSSLEALFGSAQRLSQMVLDAQDNRRDFAEL